jgi:tetratricopeptide (TPR) repeat protein
VVCAENRAKFIGKHYLTKDNDDIMNIKGFLMLNKRVRVIILAGVGLLSASIWFFMTRNVSFNIQSSLKIGDNIPNNNTQNILLENKSFENNKNNGFEYKQKALEEKNQSQRMYYWNEAINAWKTAIALNRNDTIVLNEIGYGYYYLMNLTQDNSEALDYFNIGIEYFSKVLSIDTNFYWSLFGIGVLYADIAERTPETIEYLRESIKYIDRGLIYNGDYDWIHSSKGWSYYKLGNITKDKKYYVLAIEEFDNVLKLDKNNQYAKDGIRYCNEMLQ